MLSPFLLHRAATFAFFIACNAAICSVASWNLTFAQDLPRIAQIDSFLIFVGAFGLIVVFSVIFIDVLRKGAVSSRVWFELGWLILFGLLNLAGAAVVTDVTPEAICSFSSANSHSSGSACTSARVLVVFLWLNTGFVFVYFFLLVVFAIMHQKEDNGVWHSTVRDFPWFATKQCLRSAPGSPIMSRFTKTKSPSLVAPKPRRPPPLFIHSRAGLSSRVDIEHLTDVGIVEEQPLPSISATIVPALPFYPQYVQTTMRGTTTAYQNNTYYPSRSGLSPPPIRNWPRPITNDTDRLVSERVAQKQRAPAPPSRSGLNTSSNSQKSERSTTRDGTAVAQPKPSSPARSRPTGPRTRSGSSTFVRPRPPPLDLTRHGSTPTLLPFSSQSLAH